MCVLVLNVAMDWARIGRDYLDTLIWPVVALVLIILFLFWFRDQIRELIKNIRRVEGPGQLALDVEPQEQSPESSAIPPANEEFEAAIKEAAGEIEQLKQSSGAYYLYWQYENTFRLAYGTQIELLILLASSDGTGELAELVHRRHVNLARKVEPNYDLTFTLFISFLTSRGLMAVDSKYRITDSGRAFLNWMKLQGLESTYRNF